MTLYAYVDSACRQPIQIRNGDSGSGKKQQRVCEFCKCPVPESRIIQAFRSKPSVATTTQDDIGWIEWQLDDGGDRTIMSYGCDEVNKQGNEKENEEYGDPRKGNISLVLSESRQERGHGPNHSRLTRSLVPGLFGCLS